MNPMPHTGGDVARPPSIPELIRRAAITRRLLERNGFDIVAVEKDWPFGV
jgi:hypothetical protein